LRNTKPGEGTVRKDFHVEIIENLDEWRKRYSEWLKERSGISSDGDVGESYPFVINKRAPFVPVRRALSMLSLALISSAGAYLDGTEPFDVHAEGGDVNFREIPIEVEAEDLRFAARGYDPAAVQQDFNVQLPLVRLCEFEANRIIGQLNPVFWSFCGFIADAARLVDEMVPRLTERVKRYEVQAALLIPASRLCHQSVSLVARGLEQAGLPTMTLAIARDIVEDVRPPRAAVYNGEIGSVVGKPGWPEFQRRVLDEALRLIEPMDQPGVYQLAVDLESQVERQRGER
jgi:D-proline reductase (dithiol) PrdB